MQGSIQGLVAGACDPRFERVRAAFTRNFAERGEVGAAVAVYYRGEPVVDLWGGLRDAPRALPWERDTMACMMSVGKGICATAVAMAKDRDLVDLDAPVARYWPAFAQAGKENVTVRTALSHLAGVPVTDGLSEGDIYDFGKMAAGIAAQAPLWPPGTTQFYHSATIGHIVSSILRGATGLSVAQFLRREIAEPLGADYFFELTPDEEARCATMIPSANNMVNASKREDPASVAYRQWRTLPASEDFNSHAWRSAQIPAVNGHGTARGVARIYGAVACGGRLDGVVLGRPESFAALATEQPGGGVSTSGYPLRMGVGYMLNSPPHRPMGPNLATFGHSGAGGAQGFADPVAQVGYCYCCNRMHDGVDVGPRALALIESTYEAIA